MDLPLQVPRVFFLHQKNREGSQYSNFYDYDIVDDNGIKSGWKTVRSGLQEDSKTEADFRKRNGVTLSPSEMHSLLRDTLPLDIRIQLTQ